MSFVLIYITSNNVKISNNYKKMKIIFTFSNFILTRQLFWLSLIIKYLNWNKETEQKNEIDCLFIFELISCFQIQYLVNNFNNFLRIWDCVSNLAYWICKIEVNRLRVNCLGAISKARKSRNGTFWNRLIHFCVSRVIIFQLRAYI